MIYVLYFIHMHSYIILKKLFINLLLYFSNISLIVWSKIKLINLSNKLIQIKYLFKIICLKII